MARADGAMVATSQVVGIDRTIAFAFLSEIGLVLPFKPVQPEAVLSFTYPVPRRLRSVGGTR